MHTDWIIAAAVFFVLVGWAFGYYSGLFTWKADALKEEASTISSKVLDFLLVNSYTLPASFYSDNTTSGSVLYFDFGFPAGTRNSTKVFSGQTPLPCMLEGNRIYWQADLEEGENIFRLEFSEISGGMNCDSNLSTENKSMALPWVLETKKLVSQEKIDEMLSKPYKEFRRELDIHRNFRIETEGISQPYGPVPPPAGNVYVKETLSKITESNEDIRIRVLVW